jgi:hypothetical protein
MVTDLYCLSAATITPRLSTRRWGESTSDLELSQPRVRAL